MKKILLSLGSLVSIAAPVAAVVSCGDDTSILPATQGPAPTVLDGTKQTTLKASANSALGMNANDIDSVAKIANFTVYDNGSSKNLKNVVIYNVKKTVKSITINDAHGAPQHITTDGGGRIIIGLEAPTKRTASNKIVVSTRVVVEGKESNKFFNVTDQALMAKIGKNVLSGVYGSQFNYYTVADLAGSGTEIDKTATFLKDVIQPKLQTLTTEIFKTDIEASNLTTDHKNILKNFVDYYSSDVKLAYHIMNFSAASLVPVQLQMAQTAMANDANGNQYQAVDVIAGGWTTIDEIIEGIVEKFAGEDDRFVTATVQLSYKVDKAKHQLLPGVFATMADTPMGGRETLEYILSHGSTPWTIGPAAAMPAGLAG